jgi:hypothetical protein
LPVSASSGSCSLLDLLPEFMSNQLEKSCISRSSLRWFCKGSSAIVFFAILLSFHFSYLSCTPHTTPIPHNPHTTQPPYHLHALSPSSNWPTTRSVPIFMSLRPSTLSLINQKLIPAVCAPEQKIYSRCTLF